MKFLPFTATPQQRDNLAILADVLASPERRKALAPTTGFDMTDYRSEHECGSVACAIGWGPIAGIGWGPIASIGVFDPTVRVNWPRYMLTSFGLGTDPCLFDDDSNAEAAADWVMRGDWAYVDNTPEGAATRIRILLSCGIPERHCGYQHTPETIAAYYEECMT